MASETNEIVCNLSSTVTRKACHQKIIEIIKNNINFISLPLPILMFLTHGNAKKENKFGYHLQTMQEKYDCLLQIPDISIQNQQAMKLSLKQPKISQNPTSKDILNMSQQIQDILNSPSNRMRVYFALKKYLNLNQKMEKKSENNKQQKINDVNVIKTDLENVMCDIFCFGFVLFCFVLL